MIGVFELVIQLYFEYIRASNMNNGWPLEMKEITGWKTIVNIYNSVCKCERTNKMYIRQSSYKLGKGKSIQRGERKKRFLFL